MIRSPLIYCLFLSISLERSSLIHHYIPYYMYYLVSTRHTFCTPNVKVGPQLTDKYAHLKGRYVSCRLHFNNNKNILLLEIHLYSIRLFLSSQGTQSFTSLKTVLRQDINGGFWNSSCGTFPWRKCCCVKALVR